MQKSPLPERECVIVSQDGYKASKSMQDANDHQAGHICRQTCGDMSPIRSAASRYLVIWFGVYGSLVGLKLPRHMWPGSQKIV